MKLQAVKTVRIDGDATKPTPKVAELMEKHGYSVFFAGGGYPKVPEELGKALVKANVAVEVS